MAARIAVALVAVVVLVWLGVMERNTRLVADGIAAAGRPGMAGDLPRAASAFRRAGLLNPDTRPDVLWAAIQGRRGRRDEATRALERVLRGEPDDLGAWVVLLAVAGDDAAIARRARAALRRLDPITAPR